MKHGYAKRKKQHHLYKIWCGMVSRCYNKNVPCFYNYGGRGITVCKEWKENPVSFIEWAKDKWISGLVIDRVNNDADYSPDNCHFVTIAMNNINQRKRRDNSSGFRGVNYHSKHNVWDARVQIMKERKHIGSFKTIEEAAMARDNYIIQNNLPHPLNFADGGAS
jgi:hypothetical protein